MIYATDHTCCTHCKPEDHVPHTEGCPPETTRCCEHCRCKNEGTDNMCHNFSCPCHEPTNMNKKMGELMDEINEQTKYDQMVKLQDEVNDETARRIDEAGISMLEPTKEEYVLQGDPIGEVTFNGAVYVPKSELSKSFNAGQQSVLTPYDGPTEKVTVYNIPPEVAEIYEKKGYGHGFNAGRESLNIGMLRQWLNEDRITDPKKMVTNEQLLSFLSSTKEDKI